MKKLQHPVYSVLLAIIILILVGYTFDKYHSAHPIEYIISTVEGFDHTPEGTFNRTWRIIKNGYLDRTLNHQDWGKWKKRYGNEIKTDEDLRIAEDTMLASLDDPYTRFLPKEEFEEQHRSIDSKLQGIGSILQKLKGKLSLLALLKIPQPKNMGLKTRMKS